MDTPNPSSAKPEGGDRPPSPPELPEWANGEFTVEQLQRFADDDDETDCLELSEFISELEEIARDDSHGG